jgi:hypothetical protein
MSKLAVLVGLDHYESDAFESLSCCEADATAMSELLSHHWTGEPDSKGPLNYRARLLTSAGTTRITTDKLRKAVNQLMSHGMGDGEALFYFSGHGIANDQGGYLVTQDATPENPGYPMKELLDAANRSGYNSVVIILDCCHSGQIGNITDGKGFNTVSIGANVTILAGSGAVQKSAEDWEHSVFTKLMIEALEGGASDVRGEVSAAAVYAYIEQSLGPWDQRPVYKSYARKLGPIRRCQPAVSDKVLAQLPKLFKREDSIYPMDPGYEYTDAAAEEAKVAVFDQFKALRNARLLATIEQPDLYWTALRSGNVQLTPQGRLYWKRARRGDFQA